MILRSKKMKFMEKVFTAKKSEKTFVNISRRFAAFLAAFLLVFAVASCDHGNGGAANSDNGSGTDTGNIENITTYNISISNGIEHGSVTASVQSAQAGATVTLTATPEESYVLDYYSVTDADSNAIAVTNGSFVMPASNVTVSATFLTAHLVTFNSQGGSSVASQQVGDGRTASRPANPTRQGLTFVGWYNGNNTTQFDFTTPITTPVTLNAKWSVTYIGADGTAQTLPESDFTILDGSEGENNGYGGRNIYLSAGTYVVNTTFNYSNNGALIIHLQGNVNIILCDGATMEIYGSPYDGFDGTEYNGTESISTYDLAIYGQTQGTGRLEINNALSAVDVKNFNFYGGTLSVEVNSSSQKIINVSENCNILGGKVTIPGAFDNPHKAIEIMNGTLTLGYRNSDDYISFRNDRDMFAGDGEISVTGNGTVQIANGQTMTDGTNNYSGTLTSEQINALTGKTLCPVVNNQ